MHCIASWVNAMHLLQYLFILKFEDIKLNIVTNALRTNFTNKDE